MKPTKKSIIQILEQENVAVGNSGSAVAKVAYGPDRNLLVWEGNISSLKRIKTVLRLHDVEFETVKFSDLGGFSDTKVIKILQK